MFNNIHSWMMNNSDKITLGTNQYQWSCCKWEISLLFSYPVILVLKIKAHGIVCQLLLLQLVGGFYYLMAHGRVRLFSRSGSNPFIQARALLPTCNLNPHQCTILIVSTTMQQLQHLFSAASAERCLDHHNHALTSS